ncbi:MAG: dTDP-4-dehydrorhamnose 3,5-epimerase family protein, partial [Rhodothermales bacterium]
MKSELRPGIDVPNEWQEGEIDGCEIRTLQRFSDDRGWLAEFFRHDELPDQLLPAMGYLSLTRSGVARGPHAHDDQTDVFVFYSGTFRLYVWDARKYAPTFGRRMRIDVGELFPVVVVIPPGVVHAYRNVGSQDA